VKGESPIHLPCQKSKDGEKGVRDRTTRVKEENSRLQGISGEAKHGEHGEESND